MTTTEFANLRSRVVNLAKLVTLSLSVSNVDLDEVYEHATNLQDLVGELRIVGLRPHRRFRHYDSLRRCQNHLDDPNRYRHYHQKMITLQNKRKKQG